MDQLAANDARNARYGVQETGNIAEFTDDFGAFLESIKGQVELSDPDLAKVTRVRLIGACREYPFWDLSYCYGQLRDGSNVRVDLGGYRFGRYTYKRELIDLAKAAGKYAKGLGLLDSISTLNG